MTGTLCKYLRHRLGWCPATVTLPAPQDTCTGSPAGMGSGNGQPGSALSAMVIPGWFTVISIAVLFATFFVGGNTWWPPLVLVIAGAGLVTLYCSGNLKWSN